ncbi:MAG: CoA transferase [Candidatus Competibacteraceae bacterium]|nr:CoA transferase [Candidatus Competibacteraceae bacterium]
MTKPPLHDIRILDLSRLVAGNMLTHNLADFGAEVIKIERPGVGDDLRNWRVEGVATHWKVYARNKKSLSLDLRQPQGRDILLKLVESAHVLVENFVPGTLERWQLGPTELHARNPGLIIARVSGWGQTGPYREKPGFGSLVEAMSGFAAMTGFPDRPPVLPPLALADMIAGLSGAMAVLTALRACESGGQAGQVIDLSLFEPIFSTLGPQALNYQLTGETPQRMGSRTAITAPRNVYACKDGRYVALSASMQGMAERLFRAIGRAELIDDPRFRSNTDRVANNDALDAIIAEFMAAHTQEECLAIFSQAQVTVGPVCDIEQLMEHPYIEGREVLVNAPDPELGSIPMHNVTPRLNGTPGSIRSPAPELGQHNAELLMELGFSSAEIEQLAQDKII